MGDAADARKALVNLPDGDASAGGRVEGVAFTSVQGVSGAIWLNVLAGEVADAIADQRHIVIGQRGDDQAADAGGSGSTTSRKAVSRLDHFAMLIFHEQMARFGRAVKIEDGHAEHALQQASVNDAHKFVAAQNEPQRGQADAVALAVLREANAVNRVNVEKLRLPISTASAAMRARSVSAQRNGWRERLR